MQNVKCPKCDGIHTTGGNYCEVCGHRFIAKREEKPKVYPCGAERCEECASAGCKPR